MAETWGSRNSVGESWVKEVIRDLENVLNYNTFTSREIDIIENKIQELSYMISGKLDTDKIVWQSKRNILGRYKRNVSGQKSEIMLYLGGIVQCFAQDSSLCIDPKELENIRTMPSKHVNAKELSLAVTKVFIHEVFHAYYDSESAAGSPLIPEIEEPLVEFATLKFIQELYSIDKGTYEDLFNFAKNNIKLKQYDGLFCYYGFGYYLLQYEFQSNVDLGWIDMYRSNKCNLSSTDAIIEKYKEPFAKGRYPFASEYHQVDLLYQILNPAQLSQEFFFSAIFSGL